LKTNFSIKKVLLIVLAILLLQFSFAQHGYKTAIDYVIKNKYMSEYNGNFNGGKNITRNEIAQILYNIDNQKNKKIKYEDYSKYGASMFTSNKNFSGVLINKNTILSCAHFTESNSPKQEIIVFIYDSMYVGEVIKIDFEKDLSLIKINSDIVLDYYPSLTQAELGEDVFYFGNGKGLTSTLKKGYVSSTEKIVNGIKLGQLQIESIDGDSGSGILNQDGNIIGIVKSKHAETNDISFFVTYEKIIDFMGNTEMHN
jgi:hypothetical protein